MTHSIPYSDAEEGVSCFYLNGDDIDTHKKLIQFFMEDFIISRLYSMIRQELESMGMILRAR